jgi:hypothetical protein
MNENKEYVYLIDGWYVERCEIVRRTTRYIYIKKDKSEYKIHKSDEYPKGYYEGYYGGLFFYKPTEAIEQRYKKSLVINKLRKITRDLSLGQEFDDGLIFRMIESMKEFMGIVEANREMFLEDKEKESGEKA